MNTERLTCAIPDIFRQPGMESDRMNLLEWRQNGFESRLATFEEWAGIGLDDGTLDSANERIAEGMTGVTHDVYARMDAIESRLSARIAALESRLARQLKEKPASPEVT